MAKSINALEKLQIGLETTPGTLVAATHVFLAEEGGSYEPEIDREPVEEPRGVLAEVEDVDVRQGTLLKTRGALDFEQLLFALLCGLDGTVTGVDQGDGGPYLWEFEPAMTAPDALKSCTFEVSYTDGSSRHLQEEFGYATCERIALDIAFNQRARLETDWFGRAAQASSYTGSLAPLAREIAKSNLFNAAINTAWDDLGDTAKGMVKSARVEIRPGTAPGYNLRQRADNDFTDVERGMITGSIALTCNFDGDAATEYAAWRSGALRFIRLQGVGSANRELEVDMALRYTSAPRFSVDDGLRMVELNGAFRMDPTSSKVLRLGVTNNVASLTA